MAKDPAFLFYTKDFYNGVADLTMEERGQYITLLCLQHTKGHLTEKMIQINVPDATADVLAKFEHDSEGKLFNKRLEQEIGKRKEHAQKQRDRALSGWEKRKSKKNKKQAVADTPANAAALPLVNVNVNEDLINGNKGGVGEKEPGWQEFKNYALEKKPRVSITELKLKYEAWVENGWKTGGEKPRKIKNWKVTLLNTLPHIRECPREQPKKMDQDVYAKFEK